MRQVRLYNYDIKQIKRFRDEVGPLAYFLEQRIWLKLLRRIHKKKYNPIFQYILDLSMHEK